MGAYVKRKPIRDIDRRYQWAMYWIANYGDCCMGCGKGPKEAGLRGFSVHHIIKPGRSDEECNLLYLCGICHDLAENRFIRYNGVLLPRLTMGACLSIKKDRDPVHFNLERCIDLFGRAATALELEPIPAIIDNEFKQRRRK